MAPSRRLQGEAAIITGGEGSIGMATARALVALLHTGAALAVDRGMPI